ncbi:MAG: glycosyltransferase family 2 protein [Chloroflexi bacterium]|nr:glycosyltransferase family 2 protein [Chloroflexota bacterium]
MLDVSIVVVSFNTVSFLEGCLSSLCHAESGLRFPAKAPTSGPRAEAVLPGRIAGQRPLEGKPGLVLAEAIVVDNGSADGSREMVAAGFPQVRLIANDENRGFAAANNQGMRIASGRYILLLNSDTVVRGRAIATLVEFLDAHPAAAVASAQLENPDGTHQDSAFRFPGLLMTFFDFFPINHRLRSSRLNGRYPRPKDGRPFEIDHPLGACMMVRQEAIADVGLLDEQFFMYCEEVDWCLRMKTKVWRVYCVPEARIVHYGGQSARQVRSVMYAELFKSRARFYRKHRSPLFRLLAKVIMKLGFRREIIRAKRRFKTGAIDADGLRQELATLGLARLAVDDNA